MAGENASLYINKMNKKYIIEVSEEQLRLLNMACEFTSRFICGQTDTSSWPSAALHNKEMDINDKSWVERRNKANELMDELKMLVWKRQPNEFYGVGFHEDSDGLWDMYQTFRHELWKQLDDEHKQATKNTVMSHPAMQFGKLSLPYVKAVDVD